jgi:hypothetical protein
MPVIAKRARQRAVIPGAALVALVLTGTGGIARAQDFTHDGYTAEGAYQLSVEIDPYLFLPHAEASASGLGPRGRAGASGSIGAWKIVQSLDGAFMGNGIVRYGPYTNRPGF